MCPFIQCILLYITFKVYVYNVYDVYDMYIMNNENIQTVI